MRRAFLSTFFMATLLLTAPSVGRAQLIGSEESRARRACISEAQRQGWDVREVTGFRSRGSRSWDIQMLAGGRTGARSEISCSWDGRRATIEGEDRDGVYGADDRYGATRERSSDDRGAWQGGGSSAVDACELALLERMRAEGRQRGYANAEAYIEQQDNTQTRERGGSEELIRGTGSYRFGNGRYNMMRFECRIDPRARRVVDVRYDLEGGEPGSDDRYGRDTRNDDANRDGGVFGGTAGSGRYRSLTCESVGDRTRTCRASISGNVRVARRLSGAACVQGRDWWWQPDGITVANGCRAEFEYEENR